MSDIKVVCLHDPQPAPYRGCVGTVCAQMRAQARRDYAREYNRKKRAVKVDAKVAIEGARHARAEIPRRSSLGVQRRLQALVHLGWTPERLATYLELDSGIVWRVLILPPPTVSYPFHDKVDAMFRRMRYSAPSSSSGEYGYARSLATAQQWAGPFQWNDIDRDDAPIPLDRRRK